MAQTEIRCTCRRHPVLAVSEVVDGKHSIRIVSYRSKVKWINVQVVEGTLLAECRDCHRTTTIRVKVTDVQVQQGGTPVAIPTS